MEYRYIPARTSNKANQSQSPLPPRATAAAAASREEVRLWDTDWVTPGSVDVGLEGGLGLEERRERELDVAAGWTDNEPREVDGKKWYQTKQESE